MKTVVITGSTRGIGNGLARAFLGLGCNVVVSGRSESDVQRAVVELGAPERTHGSVCDVRRLTDLEALWSAAVARFGAVHIWINNAGATTTPVTLDQVPGHEIAQTIETNLLGVLYACKVAAAGMKTQGFGFIYNVEGLGSRGQTQVGLLSYGCTKAAVHYAMGALRKELKGSGVKVCAIGPGINVTQHLFYGAHALSDARWKQTKKVFNILGDLPETTTPWIAQRVLENERDGATIQWLTATKTALRFASAGFRKRDLFANIDEAALREASIS